MTARVPRVFWKSDTAVVTEVARARCELAMPYEDDLPIFVCRGPKETLRDIWSGLKHYI